MHSLPTYSQAFELNLVIIAGTFIKSDLQMRNVIKKMIMLILQ